MCHSNRGSNHFEGTEKDNMPRFSEMASHPYGIAFKQDSVNRELPEGELESFTPLLIDGRIECQTCHLLTSQTDNYLAGSGEYGELCTACHKT